MGNGWCWCRDQCVHLAKEAEVCVYEYLCLLFVSLWVGGWVCVWVRQEHKPRNEIWTGVSPSAPSGKHLMDSLEVVTSCVCRCSSKLPLLHLLQTDWHRAGHRGRQLRLNWQRAGHRGRQPRRVLGHLKLSSQGLDLPQQNGVHHVGVVVWEVVMGLQRLVGMHLARVLQVQPHLPSRHLVAT
mmetsp:Transcript_139556/g.242826  ORF Transcript_139556/g.242826 Transcript_139556/m.242826 type:complete len:183 (-) Transcript_139556:1828-2376(-)